MNFEKVSLDKLIIVGISVRTTNQNYKSQKDIAKLWEFFFLNDIQHLIPNKISDDIYCIYTDYESDYTGEYTTILGCQVSKIDAISDRLIVKEIPACTYNKYISEGEMPYCVGKTWAQIWQSDLDRKYLADFDIYGEGAKDPKNARIITYLSIK